jgi:hypothetical protein
LGGRRVKWERENITNCKRKMKKNERICMYWKTPGKCWPMLLGRKNLKIGKLCKEKEGKRKVMRILNLKE